MTWEPDRQYIVSGLQLRVVRGEKSTPHAKGDLRLDVWNGEQWVPVSMALSFFLADFHHEVEDRLYPPGLGYRGGEMYRDHIDTAIGLGWQEATRRLNADKSKKRVGAA